MKKAPAGILLIVRRSAGAWLHGVMDPFRVLLGFLPCLRDTSCADDLPISFLLRRARSTLRRIQGHVGARHS